MPTKVKLQDGREGILRDTPNADGSYDITTSSGIPIGQVDTGTAQNIRMAQTSHNIAQTPASMQNAMLDGYNSSGAPQALENLQRSWSTFILSLMWKALRYYFRAIVKGPMGDRIGVILAIVVGFVLVAIGTSSTTGGGTTLLGTLLFVFGGLIVGPIGGRVGKLFSSNNTP
ncbi:MAG TPA: hypothetical protein VHP83_19945 [Aggregatilineaceae bacterium]|nr:hypothetical protein [Aggregatilineaceae bacterium]